MSMRTDSNCAKAACFVIREAAAAIEEDVVDGVTDQVSPLPLSLDDDDREAFVQHLYREHWQELCRYIRGRFGAGPPDPQDIAQHAFTQLTTMEHPQRIKNPRAFLYRMAANAAIDDLRSFSRQSRLLKSIKPTGDPDGDFDPERILLAREKLRILQAALMSLSERDRTFLFSNRMEGLSFAEIARQAGMSASGVRLIIENSLKICQSAFQKAERNWGGAYRNRTSAECQNAAASMQIICGTASIDLR